MFRKKIEKGKRQGTRMRNKYGKNVFITGASSGIGKACAKRFAKAGCKVTGVSRSCEEIVKKHSCGGSLTMKRMDVTDEASIKRVIDECDEINIAVLAAGSGVAGPVEELPMTYAREQMEVNYFGVLNMLQAIIPKMREQGKGLIVIIGSVAGRISIPMQSHYSSSKYALEALSDALRMELRSFGIKVVVVEPGDTKTGFTDKRKTFVKEDSVYEAAVRDAVGQMEKDERGGVSPNKVAGVVTRLAGSKNPPSRRAVGIKYKLLCTAVKLLPDRLRESIVSSIYMKKN